MTFLADIEALINEKNTISIEAGLVRRILYK